MMHRSTQNFDYHSYLPLIAIFKIVGACAVSVNFVRKIVLNEKARYLIQFSTEFVEVKCAGQRLSISREPHI